MAPDSIALVYRNVGGHHIFASRGIEGLVHVADTEFEAACGKILKALTLHVRQTCGIEANYDGEEGFAALRRKVDAGSECEFVAVAGTHKGHSAEC